MSGNDTRISRGMFLLAAFMPILAACAHDDRLIANFRKEQEPAPLYDYGQTGGADSAGMHSVQEGDTLWTISQRYDLSLQDIVRVNALQPPYHLSSGQRLALPPPATYRARADDSLYGISRTFNVSLSELARQNGLKPPYAIKPGDTLRLPAPRVSAPAATPVQYAQAMPPAGRAGWSAADPDAAWSPPPRIAGPGTLPQGSGTRQPSSGNIGAEPLAPPPAYPAALPGGPEALPQPAPQANDRAAAVLASPSASLPAAVKVAATVSPSGKIGRVPPRAGSRFAWPVSGPVISGYGPKTGGLHNDGINIRVARGTQVKAAENGVIVYAGNQLKGFGNLVLIRHDDRWVTAYGHLQTIGVRRGQEIRQGEAIGTVGATGSVSEPQLHFEVRRGTEALNPALYLAQRGG